jgi:hypothetical protein
VTSIRESIRRLIRGERDRHRPDPELADRIYWTKQVGEWSPERRKSVQSALRAMVRKLDAASDRGESKYTLPELGQSEHSRASILALLGILEAFEAFSAKEEKKNG